MWNNIMMAVCYLIAFMVLTTFVPWWLLLIITALIGIVCFIFKDKAELIIGGIMAVCFFIGFIALFYEIWDTFFAG